MATDSSAAAKTSKEAPNAVIEYQMTPFEKFLETNKKRLLWGIVALAVACLGWLLYTYLKRSKQMEQGQALSKAEGAAGYREVLSKYAGSVAAGSAQLLLAEALLKEDKKDEAYQELKTFFGSQQAHPLFLKGVSDLGLHEHLRGNFDEAIKLLEQASAPGAPVFVRHNALLRLGETHVAKGLEAMKKNDSAGAKELFEKARLVYEDLKKNGGPDAEFLTKDRLQRLPHLSVPVKAPAPPPAVPAPPVGLDPTAVPPVPPAVIPEGITPAPAPATAPPAGATTPPVPAAAEKKDQ